MGQRSSDDIKEKKKITDWQTTNCVCVCVCVEIGNDLWQGSHLDKHDSAYRGGQGLITHNHTCTHANTHYQLSIYYHGASFDKVMQVHVNTPLRLPGTCSFMHAHTSVLELSRNSLLECYIAFCGSIVFLVCFAGLSLHCTCAYAKINCSCGSCGVPSKKW